MPNRHPALALLKHPYGWIATGFGCGLMPKMPGTFASLIALLPYWHFRSFSLLLVLGICVGTFLLGVVASEWAIKKTGQEDPSFVVIDEWVGQWACLALAEAVMRQFHPDLIVPPPWLLLGGLVCFRLCDIAKPWPINWIDRRIHGGLGAMLDDAAAGMLAGMLLTAGTSAFFYF